MIGTKTRRNMGRWAQSNTNGRINTGRYAPQINLDLIKSVSSNKILEIIVRSVLPLSDHSVIASRESVDQTQSGFD